MQIVVIGNGMVGHKFCDLFARHPRRGEFQLTVYGEECRPAYDRVHLSAYFSDRDAGKLSLATREWYAEAGITLRTGELVTELDTDKRELRTHLGNVQRYDYLVLATGSVPFVPPVPGRDKKGVFVYRTIEDLEAILGYADQLKQRPGARSVVMGGGLLGLEAAKATLDMGLPTDVVEFAPRLMPRQLDEVGAATLTSTLTELGLGVHLSKSTTAIAGNGSITHLEFSDRSTLPTDMLIISAGIRPRDELARKAGIEVGPRGGILADEYLRTSAPDVYAIGEAALYRDMIYGLVAPGYDMARVALGSIMADADGGCMPESIDLSTKLKLIGTDVASFGDCFPPAEASRSIVYHDESRGIYKRINISRDGKRLLGGMLVGDAGDYNMLHQIYKNGMPLPPQPEDLILGARGVGGQPGAGVLDLPDAAVICSCENVTKGKLCGLLEDGSAASVKELVGCTGAGTGCGGCKPILSDVVENYLKAQGKVVRNVICEHFPFTRQELRDLVQLKELRTYDEALDTLGSGHGCEVCKPALASIFATVYAETANPQAQIQDTNDRFLANIQRNGTYSVVPRIPGGEITPDKLLAIGRVAKKYDLYTKITGGQRIDLFGARLEELPPIWEELIAAGFESGHAYGKSLRTVKSCVGSTWCRYGMDESVSFAIEIEERYKGLRSPHKLKGGVSGCIRECAEARGKDFGLIAVEEGYNVYVCGNGGARPKHAELLAGPVDRATAVKYLDRFLMFYLRTAAPLVRTAKWLEGLDGGIAYLKSVVVDDALGLAEELETEMQGLVNGYACEWKEAISDPAMRQRFRPFVNTEDSEELAFVPLREQKMPKPW
ncbi:nitrite reductase (NADH) large subunit [Neolewinella xylanilytica]|uniref:Nitrite reductase (NADH) large subunit n=1 Tax=Neolewinella xylanilytica TaxID=1514080 RepID=A0A2S6IA58_9BACT|nr:nitrite reductase large subunit NirB [Neolewinella xylanilytica]PPK88387.1 nitrite reductase (NADH) large subunit [Neolewinella xylanilytica]